MRRPTSSLVSVLCALGALPCLWLLAGCTFDLPPNTSFERSKEPARAAIFCNVEATRECATFTEAGMGIDVTRQEEDGFLVGKSTRYGLDTSPEALAACAGLPRKVLFRGAFPDGSPVCVSAERLGVGPGQGLGTGTFPSVVQACQDWCDAQGWIDNDGNRYGCNHIAWPAAGAWNAMPNVCTDAGTLKPDFRDLRKIAPQAVVWTNFFEAQAIGGNGLRKTSAPASWTAGAAANRVLPTGDGYFEFTATESDKDRMAGLAIGSLPDLHPSYTDINFAIALRDNRTVAVVESGIHTFTLPESSTSAAPAQYNAGDRFRVAVVGGTVQYFRNGAVFYTSALPVGYPLRVSVALRHQFATIADAHTSF